MAYDIREDVKMKINSNIEKIQDRYDPETEIVSIEILCYDGTIYNMDGKRDGKLILSKVSEPDNRFPNHRLIRR